MNIREFRTLTEAALRDQGFVERKVCGQKVWTLPSEEVVRFFQPLAYRRPWGFLLSGIIGIEIPALRAWLQTYKPGDESGIFRGCFVAYNIANEDVFRDFTSTMDGPVAADLWAGLLLDRLEVIPSRLDDLIDLYRCNREGLGWLAHSHERFAWDFLKQWHQKADPNLSVPKRSPTGTIV